MDDNMKRAPLLRMERIEKSFSGVKVLEDVSLEAYSGEILALLGQNGAGKSTLMKILSGVHPAGSYSGAIELDGKRIESNGLLEAEKNGIVMIPQEVEVCKNLNVAETLYINELISGTFINWNEIYSRARRDLESFSITDISPECPMHLLSKSQHQLIMIAKAFAKINGESPCKILILDEPTASLSEHESNILFEHLKKAKEAGMTCIYISHRLNEVFNISDRFAIMRDGAMIGSYQKGEISMDEAIVHIIGQRLNKVKNTATTKIGDVVLEVRDLHVYSNDNVKRPLVKGVSFDLHEGEILGVFGLLGSGKTEVAMALYGAWQGAHTGEVKINGKPGNFKHVKEAMAAGMGLLPEDRRESLMNVRSIKENMSIVFLDRLRTKLGTLDASLEQQTVHELRDRLKLKTRTLDDMPSTLSGGNKQKILIARLLGAQSRIIIVDEPTIGVDINTRQDIYNTLMELADKEKCAILFFSSDIEEVIQVSNQMMVMRNGTVTAFIDQAEIASGTVNADRILKMAVTG